MSARILLVEDDGAIAELVRYNLVRDGFDVALTGDGEEALLLIEESRPDLLVLDWMIPGLSGLELCRRLRRRTETRNLPIILLTARIDEADRVRGLEVGADDYVTKPFSPRELVARVRAVLRRIRPALAQSRLDVGDLRMDLDAHRVYRGERELALGPIEYRLLRHLMESPGRVFSRTQLLDAVWGSEVAIEPRTVDVHIRRLRKAVNGPAEPDLVRTVRSAGYALDVGPVAA